MAKISKVIGSFLELIRSIFKRPETNKKPPPIPFIRISENRWVREDKNGKVQIYTSFSKEMIERKEKDEAK